MSKTSMYSTYAKIPRRATFSVEMVVDTCCLDGSKEALHHGIVVGIALAAMLTAMSCCANCA